MPLNHRSARPVVTLATPATRRGRPANPSCRGGASSVLRLTQPAAAKHRLPTAFELSDWMSHAASVLMPVTGPHFEVSPRTAAASR